MELRGSFGHSQLIVGYSAHTWTVVASQQLPPTNWRSLCLQNMPIIWVIPTAFAFACTRFHKQTVLIQCKFPEALNPPTDRLELHRGAEWHAFSTVKYWKRCLLTLNYIRVLSIVMYILHDYFLSWTKASQMKVGWQQCYQTHNVFETLCFPLPN